MTKLIRLVAITSLLASALFVAPVVDAGPKSCAKRVNDTPAKLMECVTLEGVRAHQAALQDIADDNDGTRAAGTEGYEDSVDYIAGKLSAAGYNVTIDEFPFIYVAPPYVEQLTPTAGERDSLVFTGTGYGEITGAITPVDLVLALPFDPVTSGCEGAYAEAAIGAPLVADPAGVDDFAGFPAGNIALVQRGTCSFALKAANAQAAGASAVIFMNQGNTPVRSPVFNGTAVPPAGSAVTVFTIPLVGVSTADGILLAAGGSTALVRVDAPESRPQKNVLAESTTGDPNNVIMAGAHLDSVQSGPGINDNGSGSAGLLEVALQMAKVKPINQVRFAWWGAEESNLVGSTAYVAGLSEEERDQIELYLNFDMIGSPNYVFFIYDGDDSDAIGFGPGPDGSAEIEAVFEAFYDSRGEDYKGTDFTGRSDYGPFIAPAVGIPSGGLFTGAEGVKTAEEAAIWGGTVGAQYDPCYHLVCDTYANNNNHALDVNSDSIANAVILYAMGVEVLPEPLGARSGGSTSSGGHEDAPTN